MPDVVFVAQCKVNFGCKIKAEKAKMLPDTGRKQSFVGGKFFCRICIGVKMHDTN